jgi:hypothetical protein
MDRTVRPVPDRTMTVDRTVAYHGSFQRLVGPPFARKWIVPTRGPNRTVDRAGPWTGPSRTGPPSPNIPNVARYITQKEQPISMGNCLSFARLVIRGCGQPLYKRFHHRKMVAEIKR